MRCYVLHVTHRRVFICQKCAWIRLVGGTFVRTHGVEIQHEKLGAKLHTDTFSYVKTCTRKRPCKYEHVWVVNTLRGNMAVEKNIGNYVVSCTQTRPPVWQFAHGDVLVSQKLHSAIDSDVEPQTTKSASLWILFDVVSSISFKRYAFWTLKSRNV